MKFVALVSGGKDSIYNIIECVRNGHKLVACVHLGAPVDEQDESYMYQTAASEVLPALVEECLGVPLVLYERKGTSANTSLVYETTSDKDEVEDLYEALALAKERFPEIQAAASGAILSTYQRVRIEHVCSRLGLASLSYLWRIDSQHELLKRMLDDGIVAILVKTACPPGLVPRKHLNESLGTLYTSGLLQKLHRQYQFHMCGEGGEYESLVLDCPIYKKRLVLDDVEIVETDDGVGVLVIKSCHAELKLEGAVAIPPRASTAFATEHQPAVWEKSEPLPTPRFQYLPRVRRINGGLLHLSEIMSPVAASLPEGATEADLAVEEAIAVLHLLHLALTRHGATAQDVLMVHLYLSEISHFALINAHYREFFGTLLPPSRSCVAVGKGMLPGGRRVLLDCMVQCGSGQYMRSNADEPYSKAAQLTTTASLRQVLHVQSISYWAPVCVGPYSQVNTLRSGLHFLAGQIGLVPVTMKLRDTWPAQLEQCWTNVARVLDALDGGSLKNLLSCLVYVSEQVYSQSDAWATVESISRRNILTNSSVVPGAVESMASLETLYGGYEDEETWREMTNEEVRSDLSVPLLFVSIPEMPMGSLVEVEAVCSSQCASSSLHLKSFSHTQDDVWSPLDVGSTRGWDTGYDFPLAHPLLTRDICVNVSTRAMGYGCAAIAIVSASIHEFAAYDEVATSIDIENLLDVMVGAAFQDDFVDSSGLSMKDILHVRLYHIGALLSDSAQKGVGQVNDDGMRLRTSLHAVLASRFDFTACNRSVRNVAAASVVPVQAMKVVSPYSSPGVEGTTILAMQVLIADPVHMENELWIHRGRKEK